MFDVLDSVLDVFALGMKKIFGRNMEYMLVLSVVVTMALIFGHVIFSHVTTLFDSISNSLSVIPFK